MVVIKRIFLLAGGTLEVGGVESVLVFSPSPSEPVNPILIFITELTLTPSSITDAESQTNLGTICGSALATVLAPPLLLLGVQA